MVDLPQHFSVFRHLALLFWNHTCKRQEEKPIINPSLKSETTTQLKRIGEPITNGCSAVWVRWEVLGPSEDETEDLSSKLASANSWQMKLPPPVGIWNCPRFVAGSNPADTLKTRPRGLVVRDYVSCCKAISFCTFLICNCMILIVVKLMIVILDGSVAEVVFKFEFLEKKIEEVFQLIQVLFCIFSSNVLSLKLYHILTYIMIIAK